MDASTKNSKKKPKKVILVIRDGWGYRKSKKDNAIANTNTPHTNKLMKQHPNTLLDASGEAVGLPKGYQGNSEVGHMTIGSGRIILQSMEKINQAIKNKTFYKISEFSEAIKNCKKNKSKLHLLGLLQTEGVHSHINHLFAILDLCKKQRFKDVYIHIITDGRDSPIYESLNKLKQLEKKIKRVSIGKIMTISGRYYSMDRNKRWERTKKAYDCIVQGKTNITFTNPTQTIKQSHKQKITDEFIIPRKHEKYKGIKSKDSIIFYNFRTDRTRQLTRAIVEQKFEGWKRNKLDVYYVAMTQFYRPMNAKVAFKDINLKNLLGKVIADKKIPQFRISETEKYAHVTFFFNGQIEEPNKKEDRLLIQSPNIATYDLKPEMSAYEVTEQLNKKIRENKYGFIVVNLVNGDMVGHSGKVPAIKKAIKAVDECIGKIVEQGLKNNYNLLVFADHGNAEDQTPKWRTSHTINKVPFILISNNKKLENIKLKKNMGLKDIAPTVLDILEIQKPKEMTGKTIIYRKNKQKF